MVGLVMVAESPVAVAIAGISGETARCASTRETIALILSPFDSSRIDNSLRQVEAMSCQM
jgi:hypothetical protein